MADAVKTDIEKPVAEETESVVAEKSDLNNDFKQPSFEEKKSNSKTGFPHGLQFGAGVSLTSGLNGFVGYNNKNFDSFWAKRFGVRFDFATFEPIKKDLKKEIKEDAGEIKLDDMKIENIALNGHHYGALVDFYPFGNTWFLGGWRLSGGYFTGKLDLSADIKSTHDGVYEFELDGATYSYDIGDVKGKTKVGWKYSGPYVGTGFDLGLIWGFKIYMDAGVVFADKAAKANLNVPLTGLKVGGVTVEGNDTLEEEFEARKNAELKKIQDDLDDYPYFPVVKLGFMYRF